MHGWSVRSAAGYVLYGAAPSHLSSLCNHTCMRVTHCSQYPTRDSWLHLQFVCARSATQYSTQRQSEIVSRQLLNVNRNRENSAGGRLRATRTTDFSDSTRQSDESNERQSNKRQLDPNSDSKQQGKSGATANLSQFDLEATRKERSDR